MYIVVVIVVASVFYFYYYYYYYYYFILFYFTFLPVLYMCEYPFLAYSGTMATVDK